VLILGAPGSGAVARECGRRVQGVLGGLLSEGRGEGAIAGGELAPAFMSVPAPVRVPVVELVVGGVFSVIRARMLERDDDCGRCDEAQREGQGCRMRTSRCGAFPRAGCPCGRAAERAVAGGRVSDRPARTSVDLSLEGKGEAERRERC